jgi:hypothetical protein
MNNLMAVLGGRMSYTSLSWRRERAGIGVRASYWPRNYGRWVRTRLAPREEFKTKEDALRAEAALARRLAERGFCVYGGH